jgi:hypothetical protein
VITAGTTATKFLTYRFDYATYPYFLGTNIYGLPGVFVGEQGIIPGNEEGRKAFPNPASTSITIPLPSKSSEANRDLIVSDANGREILRTSLAKEQLEYTLNTSSFPKGTYLYLIVSGSTVSHQDKFVVQR